MSDLGHNETDKELKRIEDLISKEYAQAARELEEKMKKHYADFDRKDAEMKAKVDSGEITKAQYQSWRVGQIATGDRWREVRDSMVDTLVNKDKAAAAIIQGNNIKAYGDNMNYGTYEVEHGSEINTGFSLYDVETVKNLMKEDPKIIPMPKVDIPKDELWNRQKLTSAVMQGILQGESMGGIAKRLSSVAAMDANAAIRNARTYTTAAENKGRLDSYERAEKLGIKTNKKWIATLDDRTRMEHRHLDNMVVAYDADFEVDGYTISYPGDPSAEPEMIYNCRCTLVADIPGINYNDERNDSKLGDMTYEEWKHAKDRETEEPAELKRIGREDFGEKGIYHVYRSGEVFDSPLGYTSFAMEKWQAEEYIESHPEMGLNEYDVKIENPIVGDSSFAKGEYDKFASESALADIYQQMFGELPSQEDFLENLEEYNKKIVEEAERRGYDSLLLDVSPTNNLTGETKYEQEIALLNSHKENAELIGVEEPAVPAAEAEPADNVYSDRPTVDNHIKGVSKKGGARSEWLQDTLGIDEEEAEEYLDSISEYTKGNYAIVHNNEKEAQETIEALDGMLHNPNMPIYDGTIYRGVHVLDSDGLTALEKVEAIIEGGTWNEPGITSFSSKREKASQFAAGGAYGDKTEGVNVLIINNKNISGCPIQHLTDQRPEGEVLVPSDIKDRGYNIVKYKIQDKVEEIPKWHWDEEKNERVDDEPLILKSKWAIIEVEENGF